MTNDWKPLGAPPLYSQDGKGYDAVVHAHYFTGSSDWLVTEYDPEDDIAFGWACLGGDRQNAELGYISMAELAAVRVPVHLHLGAQELVGRTGVEREEGWTPLPLQQAIALLDQRQGRA